MNDTLDLNPGAGSLSRLEPLAIRVIQDAAGWDAIRAEWDQLYAVSPTASPPLDFAWLRCWWRLYGPVYGVGGLRIITLWRGRQLAGVLPLYLALGRGGMLSASCLRFISTGEAEFEETCPDYLNLLCHPGDEQECAQAAWRAVYAMPWDTLELLDLPADSPLLRWRGNASSAGKITITERGSCPIANLGEGFETYLAHLSAKSRKTARQEIRKAELSGAVLELVGAEDADHCFDDLVRLHQARWVADGKPGCFSAPRFTEFHRQLVRQCSPSGRVVLARLSHQGQAQVVLYGFVTGAKFDLYQMGINPAARTLLHSPGTAANLLLMMKLVSRGITRYDFLRGNSVFKKSLATQQQDVVRLTCRRITARALLDQMHRLSLGGLRRVLRRFAVIEREGAGDEKDHCVPSALSQWLAPLAASHRALVRRACAQLPPHRRSTGIEF